MTITDEGEALRVQVAALRPLKRRPFSDELKVGILDWVERAMKMGWLQVDCLRTLGITYANLASFHRMVKARRKEVRETMALVPITEAPPTSTTSNLVISVGAIRVEGLALDELITVLRGLA